MWMSAGLGMGAQWESAFEETPSTLAPFRDLNRQTLYGARVGYGLFKRPQVWAV